jgi:CheY-like chemotaxis protein
MNRNIPCYYYPTTPVFIDDEPGFLMPLVENLKPFRVCQTWTSPQEALAFLQQAHSTRPFPHFCLGSLNDEIPEHRFTALNIQSIPQQIYDSKRFTTLAVVVVDYTMPGLNGLAFCERLNTSYKKLLLTSAADEKIAIEAFNQGLIQGYLRKDDPLLEERLCQAIQTLEWNYFLDMSKVVTDNMTVHSKVWGKSYFTDPDFADIFYPFYTKQKPVEYYLSAMTGSFLFLDNKGNTSELAVVDEALMRTFEDFIDPDEGEITTEIFTAIQNRKQLLASHPETIQKPPAEWLPYLYPAQKVESHGQCYYYSYIEQSKPTGLRSSDIFSYQSYLEEFD